jgi:hypothetical protein
VLHGQRAASTSAAIHAVSLSPVAAPCDDDVNRARAHTPMSDKGRSLQKNVNGRWSVLIFLKFVFISAANFADDSHSACLRSVHSRVDSNLGNCSRLDCAVRFLSVRRGAAAASDYAHARVPMADGSEAVMQCKMQSRNGRRVAVIRRRTPGQETQSADPYVKQRNVT